MRFLLFIFLPSIFVNCTHESSFNNKVIIDSIVVIKHKRKLIVYSEGKKQLEYKISLGSQPIGAKHFQGDHKTPEGKYFINAKNPHSSYYLNLGISYPNKKDRNYAKKMNKNPGGDIKIHGMKNNFGFIGVFHLLIDWTDGCIAVTNKQIEQLYKLIPIGTPIIIYP